MNDLVQVPIQLSSQANFLFHREFSELPNNIQEKEMYAITLKKHYWLRLMT